MITTQYDYTSGTGFLYDATKIGFDSNGAHLLLADNPGQTFTPTISASSYDSSILEYVGGVLRQKDQRPANATFFAAWSALLNANWSGPGNGSLSVTPVNGATIAGSALNLTGSSNKYVTMSATNNMDSLQSGTIQFQWTPNYSGTPGQTQIMFNISDAVNSKGNLIDFEHYSDGNIYLEMYENDGITLALQIVTPFVAVASRTYLFVINFDTTTGTANIYIDGVLKATTTAGTFTRSGAVAYAVIGKYYDASAGGNANFSIKNFSYYSTAEIPGSVVLNPTAFDYGVAILPNFIYPGMGAIQGYTAFSENDSGTPHYTMSGNYWDGMNWVVSDETYANANDKATINANIAAMAHSNTLTVRAIYQAGNVQQSIGVMTVTYIGQLYNTTNPTISPNTPLTMDAISEFRDMVIIPGSTSVTFYLLIGSSKYWWDGAAWSISSGLLAQTNDASTIQTHQASIPISLGAFVTPVALLHSPDGTTTPSLRTLIITYDYFGPNPGGPNTCSVYGYIYDEKNQVIPNAIVSVTNPTTFINQEVVIAQGIRTSRTNEIGYFEITLVETETVSKRLSFSVDYPVTATNNVAKNTFTFGRTIIPNSPTINIADMTFIT